MRFTAPEGTELLGHLPSGSMFQVARIVRDGRVAVCKRLLPRARNEPAARAALGREVASLARVRHRSVPELLQVGHDADGPFVVQSMMEGASVRAITTAWRDRGASIPPHLLTHVACASVEALAEIHELGLSHGDLGPDHVLMDATGAIAFVDFGAARFDGMSPTLETSDRGTLPFASPEVARGDVPPGQPGDVYATAATLLFAAGGGRPLVPVEGDAAMLLLIGEHGLPAEVADRATSLDPGVRDALRRAISLDPTTRLATARALLSALSR